MKMIEEKSGHEIGLLKATKLFNSNAGLMQHWHHSTQKTIGLFQSIATNSISHFAKSVRQ
jgi:hypothetical protein